MAGGSSRNIVLAAFAAGTILLVGAVVAVVSSNPFGASETTLPKVQIGGPFSLTTHTGATLSNDDLKGKPFAVFFGFTHCPEVCPTTLFDMSEALKALGPDADKLAVLFVSLDPTRDTPELLKDYLSVFDPHIVGLAGSEADIEKPAKAYRVYWRKVPTDDGADYTLDHTATVYLMDGNGDYADKIDYQEPLESRVAKLKALIGASG